MHLVEGCTEIDDIDTFVEKISAIGAEHGVTVQTFDARYVADAAHLRRAVDHAVRAIERGEAIADDPGVEILLYAAGRRQINRALEMGVSAGKCPVVGVAVDCDAHDYRGDPVGTADRPSTEAERDAAAALEAELDPESTLDATEEKRLRSYFEVTDRELAATDGTLSDLVRERVTLLVVDR
ncbi:KEOPS complex subunit Cgi121 [Halovenus sp. HT40]|uniref:KEOPS complex subunit Cgi121 n=1 Tax=Halovenus sp. HT40 TaxID=3126691 RepID=UPI00300F79D1